MMRGFETGIEKCARIYTKDTKTRIVWGDKCMTDGKGTIWLPALSDRTDPAVMRRVRLNLGHEVSHVIHSNFDSVKKAIISGGASKKTILNALEDVRIERLWELEYTGCQEDFVEDYKHFVQKEFNDRLISNMESVFSKVLNVLTIRSREKQLKMDAGLNVPELVEKLFQDKVGDLVDDIASCKTMEEVEKYTEIIYKRFKEGAPPPPPPSPKSTPEKGKGKPKEKDESDSNNESESSTDDWSEGSDVSEEGSPTPPEEDRKDENEDTEGAPGESEDSENADGSEDFSPDKGGPGEDDSKDDEPSGSAGDGADEIKDDDESADDKEPSGSTVDESDEIKDEDESDEIKDEDETSDEEPSPLDKLKEELKDDMEKDHKVDTISDSRVKEINKFAETSDQYLVDPSVKDKIFKPELTLYSEVQAREDLANGKRILSYLGQRLQHLFVSKRSRRVNRFLRTGALDPYRVMEDESDLIFRKKLKGRNQDSVVGFSIDQSGSMIGPNYDLASQLSLATGYYLEQIQVPFMVLGLSGDGQYGGIRKHPVYIAILKEFNESIRKVMGRFRGNFRMEQNSDLDGLKILAKHILMRPEPKKIIFVFSDGQPCSGGPLLDNKHMNSYKEYIKRLQKIGVVVFGIGINYRVEHIFGPEYSIVVNGRNLNEFPRLAFKALSKILLE